MADKQQQFVAPPLNHNFYAESYQLRKAASTMTPMAINWFRQQAAHLLHRESPRNQTFSILSVGSGEGDVDVEIIRAFLSQLSPLGNRLKYVALEPNAIHRQRFLQRLEHASFGPKVDISVYDQRFEEHHVGEHEQPYDLVLLVHVLYYFREPHQTILHALELTRHGGQVVIVHQTPIGIPQIQRKYMQDIKGDEDEMFTTADIKKLINSHGHRFQYHEIEAHLDVTECLRGTEVGQQIMSFCMECDLRALQEPKATQILQAFWNLADIRDNGKAYIREPIGIFVVESSHAPLRVERLAGDDDPVEDYRQLAQHFHWKALFASLSHSPQPAAPRSLRLLDVACGTGRWLKALLHYVPQPAEGLAAPVSMNGNQEIVYDLLDPSPSALSQSQSRLRTPFKPGQHYIETIQTAALAQGTYDILWSMHGFYAIPTADLPLVLMKCRDCLNDSGIALIAVASRDSFYVNCYAQYLDIFHDGEGDGFTSAEDITATLTQMSIPFQIHTVTYEEQIPIDDVDAVEHYITNESIGNSFSKDDDLTDNVYSKQVTLKQLRDHKQFNRYLNSFIRGSAYYFPQEIQVIVFGNLAMLPTSFQFDDLLIGDGHLGQPGDALQPDLSEMRQLADTAMKYIIHQQEHIETSPLAGSGVEWLQTSDFNAETEAAVALAQSVEEPLPADGVVDFDGLLQDLFGRLAPYSTNDNSAGYLAFIPGGGLYHAILADVVANSLNRYVTIFMAAPGLAAIENQAIRWLCDIIGFSQDAGGVLTSGGSMANFVAAHTALMQWQAATSTRDYSHATAYVSEQSHYSVEQGLRLCGFPAENLRKVPSTPYDFRISIESLRHAIEQDRAMGFEPILLIGTAGTSNTGAVDDLLTLARIAESEDLWFHVDAAYGGFFKLTQSGGMRLQGIELADSVTLDPHKAMFLPYGTGSLLVSDKRTLKGAFSFTGAYMQPQRDLSASVPDDIMDLSPELTRDFRGLRVWLPLKMLGFKPFQAQLEEKLALSRWVANQLSIMPHIRIVAQPQLSVLAFKLVPEGYDCSPQELDELNQIFLKEINQSGNILLSPLRSLHDQEGEFCLRMAILSFRTHRDRLETGLRDIRNAVATTIERLSDFTYKS